MPLRAAFMYCFHLLSYDLWALLRLLSSMLFLNPHTPYEGFDQPIVKTFSSTECEIAL